MKFEMRNAVLFFIILAMCISSGCSKAETPEKEKGTSLKDKKILIVYLSPTKNTKAVAEIIHKDIGFPTWDMKMPPPMKSFLKQYDLSAKTIIPFNTNAGYGAGSGFETVKRLCPNSKILDGYSTKGGIERDGILFVMEGDKEKQVQSEVNKWLKKIGF